MQSEMDKMRKCLVFKSLPDYGYCRSKAIKDLGSSIHVLAENAVLRDFRAHKGNAAAEWGYFLNASDT